MANFLRQKYKEKPQAWGPVESVQRSLRINAERIGIDYNLIGLACPLWSPGNQIDYSKNKYIGTNYNAIIDKNGLRLDKTLNSWIDFGDVLDIGTSDMTMLLRCNLPATNISDTQNFGGINKSEASAELYRYGMYIYNHNVEIFISGNNNLAQVALSANAASKGFRTGIDQNMTAIYDRDALMSLYCDQKLALSANINVATIAGVDLQSSLRFKLGRYDYSNSTYYMSSNSWIIHALVLYQALKSSQIAALSDNPYQLWQRQGDVYFSIPVSAGGITLSLAGLTQSHSIDATSLTQKNTLSANSLLQAQASTAVSLTQKHMLTTSDLSQAMTLEVPTLSMAVALIVQALNHANTLESLGLIQKHNLSIDNLAQLQSLDESLNLTQKNTLSISDLIQAHNLTGINLTLADMLSVANLLHSQGTNALDIVQAHSIAVNNLHHDQSIGSVNLAMAMLLEIAGLTHAHSVDDLTISFVNLLTVDNLGHTQDLGAMTLSQAHSLLIDNLQHNQNISSVSFITARGKVTVSFTMATPGVSQSASLSNIGFQISTPSINFAME